MTHQGWHPADIKAAIAKRGHTLKSLSEAYGLPEGGVRAALLFASTYPAAEAAIVDFLGVGPAELWPERYRDPTPKRRQILDHYRSRRSPASHRQNEEAA